LTKLQRCPWPRDTVISDLLGPSQGSLQCGISPQLMSQMGQSPRFRGTHGLSALPPSPRQRICCVSRSGPGADSLSPIGARH
jgi:hypothetical protein